MACVGRAGSMCHTRLFHSQGREVSPNLRLILVTKGFLFSPPPVSPSTAERRKLQRLIFPHQQSLFLSGSPHSLILADSPHSENHIPSSSSTGPPACAASWTQALNRDAHSFSRYSGVPALCWALRDRHEQTSLLALLELTS